MNEIVKNPGEWLLSMDDLAPAFDNCRHKAAQYVQQNNIPTVRIGGNTYISDADYAAHIMQKHYERGDKNDCTTY